MAAELQWGVAVPLLLLVVIQPSYCLLGTGKQKHAAKEVYHTLHSIQVNVLQLIPALAESRWPWSVLPLPATAAD